MAYVTPYTIVDFFSGCVKNLYRIFYKSKITQNDPKIIYISQQLKTIINNYS